MNLAPVFVRKCALRFDPWLEVGNIPIEGRRAEGPEILATDFTDFHGLSEGGKVEIRHKITQALCSRLVNTFRKISENP